MKRRTLVLLAGLGLSLACGARTRLLLPGSNEGSGSAPGGSSGSVLQGACAAPLLDGAPTPMRGYCPTRANQATMNGPRAPQVAWTARPFAIDDPTGFLPADIVVDPTGHVFVAVAASPLEPTRPSGVVALDPAGNVSWRAPFQGPIAGLSLAADGTLWLVEQASQAEIEAGTGTEDAVVHGLSRDGSPARTIAIPPAVTQFGLEPIGYDALALGASGDFFLAASAAYFGGGTIARVSPDGTVRWQNPVDYQSFFSFSGTMMVAPDGRIVTTDTTGLAAFDVGGNRDWTSAGSLAAAFDRSGNVVTVQQAPTDALSLVTIDPTGTARRSAPLGSPQVTLDACHMVLENDGAAVAMLVEEAPAPAVTKAHVTLVALDATGAPRWTTSLDASLPYDPAAPAAHCGIFADASGMLVVTAGAVTGVDGATGAVLWTVQPPNAHACLRPAVLGAGGSIVASQCDGSVFLARDP